MLEDVTFAIGVRRARIAVSAGYLPVVYLGLRPGRANSLFEGLSAVVGMDGAVAIAVKDDGWDRRPAWDTVATGTADRVTATPETARDLRRALSYGPELFEQRYVFRVPTHGRYYTL